MTLPAGANALLDSTLISAVLGGIVVLLAGRLSNSWEQRNVIADKRADVYAATYMHCISLTCHVAESKKLGKDADEFEMRVAEWESLKEELAQEDPPNPDDLQRRKREAGPVIAEIRVRAEANMRQFEEKRQRLDSLLTQWHTTRPTLAFYGTDLVVARFDDAYNAIDRYCDHPSDEMAKLADAATAAFLGEAMRDVRTIRRTLPVRLAMRVRARCLMIGVKRRR